MKRLMYRSTDCSVALSQIDKVNSIMSNSPKYCESRMGMKRGTISLILDVSIYSVQNNDVVIMYLISRRVH